jgi:RNA polymerase sigma-70 factor (ECF subfamily)
MVEAPAVNSDWINATLQRYERPLLRYVIRITNDLDVARDVVQDTFLKLVKADKAKVETNLAAWLYTVARNRALDIRKREIRMGQFETTDSVPARDAGPHVGAETNEMLSRVLEALDSLSDDHREAFRLKFQDQLTYREISQIMGKSLGTISKLITTALCRVRDHLSVEVAGRGEG